MKKKEISVLRDFSVCGLEFKKGDRYEAYVLNVGFSGGFDNYPQDGTMEGNIYPAAIIEFENGKIICVDIENNVHIVGDIYNNL